VPGADAARDVIFEFVTQGAYMRVAAVDVVSGTEAVIVGPANAARHDLEALALRKLRRLLEQQQQQQ
jgi:E3 ubiquitin-protein ligase DOA10